MANRRFSGVPKAVATRVTVVPVTERVVPAEKSDVGPDLARRVVEKNQPEDSKAPVAPEPIYTDQLRVTLLRYVVRGEDDGLGGHGVDLYMGYLASAANMEYQASMMNMGNVAVGGNLSGKLAGAGIADPADAADPGSISVDEDGPHGTSQVKPSLTNRNGEQGSGRHPVNEVLFDIEVGKRPGVMRLNLIESDSTTPAIKKAYDDARVPRFGQMSGPGGVSANDVGLFFAVPFAPIFKLLENANTDDDYGQWGLSVARKDDLITCEVVDKGRTSLAKSNVIKLGPGEAAELTMQYLDNDNDIDAVLELRRVPL